MQSSGSGGTNRKQGEAAVIGLMAFMLLTSGCAPGLGGSSYSRDQARREQNVRMGVVDSVREVQIEGTRSGIGPAAGGLAASPAATIGQGRGAAGGTVLGRAARWGAGGGTATPAGGYEITYA